MSWSVHFIGGPFDGKKVRLSGTNEGPELPDVLYIRPFASSESIVTKRQAGDSCYIRATKGPPTPKVEQRYVLEGLNL